MHRKEQSQRKAPPLQKKLPTKDAEPIQSAEK